MMNLAFSRPAWLRGTLIRIVVTIALLAICFLYIYRTFEWGEIAGIIGSADVVVFVAGSSVSLILYWGLRAWRWQALLRAMGGGTHAWWDVYLATACSLAFALVTPFRSGEALKVEFLRSSSGLKAFEGYSCFVLERTLDLISVIVLAAIGLVLSAHGFGVPLQILLMAAMALAGLSAASAWWAIARSPWRTQFRDVFSSLFATPGPVALACVLSLASWLIVVAGWHECLRSIGVSLSAPHALSLTANMALVNVLSLIPGAVGVSETGIAVALGQLGHPPSVAQSGALMIRGYGLVGLLLGAFHFLAWRMRRSSRSWQ